MATSSNPTGPAVAHQQRAVPFPIDSDPEVRHAHSPRTPSTGSLDFPLLPDPHTGIPRSHTVSPTFVSSPLNPRAPAQSSPPHTLFTRSSTQSRQSMIFNRVPSEESQALASHRSSLTQNRSSMILYRLSDDEKNVPSLPNSNPPHFHSGDSVFTVSYDSKYPTSGHSPRKLVAYPFDPSLHIDTPEDDDALHDPSDDTPLPTSSGIAIRGLMNIGVLILVILALLCLFIFYPVWHFATQSNRTVQ